MLYMVRFSLFSSRVMDTNIDQIEAEILRECEKIDVKKTDSVSINCMRDIILKNKKIVLTPFQINILLGYAEIYDDHKLDYKEFAKLTRDNIERMFTVEAMRRKAQLV